MSESNPTETVFKESPFRSACKGLTWRVTATTTTICIAYAITGQVEGALTIGGIEFFVKFAIYYVHERAWQCVPRGTFRQLMDRLKGRGK